MSRKFYQPIHTHNERPALSDYQDTRHVGFDTSTRMPLYDTWMSLTTLEQIQVVLKQYIPTLKMGDIVVTDRSVWSAMDTVFRTFIPTRGDIYTKYIINYAQDEPTMMMDRVVQLIITSIQDDYYENTVQQKLDIWDSVQFGEQNRFGIAPTPPIKIRRKRIPMSFINQRY